MSRIRFNTGVCIATFCNQLEHSIEQGALHSKRSNMTNAENDDLITSNEATGVQAPLTSDAQLLRAMQMGDADAWQELYQRYLPSAWRWAWHLVGDRQVAEDLVAESLLALCRKANELDPDNVKLFGWLRGVVRHKAMDHFSAKGRRTAALDNRANLKQSIQSEQQSRDRPSARLEHGEQVNAVLVVLKDLDETKRQCLEWKYFEQLSVREMAARLDLTEKAVESTLYRARLEFRERFERQEQNDNTLANPFQSIESSKKSSNQ